MPARAFHFAVNANTLRLSWEKYCAVIDANTIDLSPPEKVAYYKERRDFLDVLLCRPAQRYIKTMKLQPARGTVIRNLLCDKMRCTEMMNHYRFGTRKP